MARLPILNTENVTDPEILAMFSWVSDMEGMVPNHFAIELNHPELFKAKLGFTKTLWEMGELTQEEIQHIGIIVSRGNQCRYCTGAFCTILSHGLGASKAYVEQLAENGTVATDDKRLQLILEFSDKVNGNAQAVTDEDIQSLASIGIKEKGVLQLIHVVSDFASYNRLNLALDTDYDYSAFS